MKIAEAACTNSQKTRRIFKNVLFPTDESNESREPVVVVNVGFVFLNSGTFVLFIHSGKGFCVREKGLKKRKREKKIDYYLK